MKNKSIGTVLILGAILYFAFTSFVVGHGIHPLNKDKFVKKLDELKSK